MVFAADYEPHTYLRTCVPTALHRAFKKLCVDRGESMQNYIVRTIAEDVGMPFTPANPPGRPRIARRHTLPTDLLNRIAHSQEDNTWPWWAKAFAPSQEGS